jgi:hypothetical protein
MRLMSRVERVVTANIIGYSGTLKAKKTRVRSKSRKRK